ncbi:MAG: hypothetical protein JO124_01520 [Hyphomicrobiales bacterium]|nr:hypothetical protein [Hyphomicrobiales bacterium]
MASIEGAPFGAPFTGATEGIAPAGAPATSVALTLFVVGDGVSAELVPVGAGPPAMNPVAACGNWKLGKTEYHAAPAAMTQTAPTPAAASSLCRFFAKSKIPAI